MLAYQFLVYLTSTLIVIPFVMKRFNDLVQIFSGKNKRSSSQLIFRILSGKKDELVNTIKQSGLIEILGINHIELESILYENTTTRLTMELPYILNLYRLAKFIQLQSIDYKG